MARRKRGIALWYVLFHRACGHVPDDKHQIRYPNPTDSYNRMKSGYVGYIDRGRFELIFDANGPLGDRTLGVDVPEDFEPLPSVANLSRTNTLPPYNIFEETKSSVQFTAGGSAYVFRSYHEVLLV